MVVTYRVNAGFVPRDHWVHDPGVGGGRVVAEVCHYVDFLQYIIGAKPKKVYAQAISEDREDIISNDNVLMNIEFEDGSIGSIAYVASGDRSFSKERIEIFCDRHVGVMEDFRMLQLVENGHTRKSRNWFD